MELNAGQYYYSPGHIARDFVATVAPFTFFLVLAVLGLPWARDVLFRAIERLEPQLSWILVAVVAAAFVGFAFVSGAIANRIFLIPRGFSVRFSVGLSKLFEYAPYYQENADAIESWHRHYVPEPGALRTKGQRELEQKVDQLIWLFQLANPSGYLNVYREYAFIFMYRQAFVYSFFVGTLALVARVWWLLIMMVVLAASTLIGVAAGGHEAVRSEFNFITATGSWLEMKGPSQVTVSNR